MKHRIMLLAASPAVVVLFLFSSFLREVQAFDNTTLAGTYRCWSFNVGGRGGVCTNPPLVLNKNGTYTLSTEKGRYKIDGNTLLLSGSKFRGPGTLTEDGMQIQFTYNYRGLAQTVTYLRQIDAEKTGKQVFLDLTVKYLKEEGWLGWVSTVELVAIDGTDKTNYTALAWSEDRRSVKCFFKKGVPSGHEYTVFLNTGTDRTSVGKIDLRKKSGDMKHVLFVKKPTNTPAQQSPKKPLRDSLTPAPPPSLSTDQLKTGLGDVNGLPKCNPAVPRYSQPQCKD